jgi:dipeptidyl aminopeptidase/acylaminoacyl peptidase
MFSEDTNEGKLFAEHNILYIIPYANPWAWTNRQTAAYTDEIIDVLIRQYHLPDDIPIVSTGGSMGGQSALVYMVYAARTPAACVANCPVCDLPFHFTERPDLPRTLYSAFGTYEGTLNEALESASPYHLTEKMPDADYYIFHCEADGAVNKQKHSDRFVEKMKADHRITYYAVPDRGHCDLTPEMRQKYNEAIISSILG